MNGTIPFRMVSYFLETSKKRKEIWLNKKKQKQMQ